jgi:dTDP-4-dehydrorhamnose 3,5-epimerase-like enzyme
MSDILIPSGLTVEDAHVLPLWSSATRDEQNINGWLLNVVNPNVSMGLTRSAEIGQVYITFCYERCRKGPHMHEGTKEDRFYCIRGRAKIICRNEQTGKVKTFTLEAFDAQLLVIPPYNSHAIVALDELPCAVLSVPTEGYNPAEKYNQIGTSYSAEEWEKTNG